MLAGSRKQAARNRELIGRNANFVQALRAAVKLVRSERGNLNGCCAASEFGAVPPSGHLRLTGFRHDQGEKCEAGQTNDRETEEGAVTAEMIGHYSGQ